MAKSKLNPLPRLGIKVLPGGILDYVQTEDRKFIRYGYWEKGDKATVIILPGRTEYIEKYNTVIQEFLDRNFSVLCVDWRGQGLSQRPHGRTDIGHVKDFFEYQIDLETILEDLKDTLDKRPKVLFSHSMGSCIGLRYLLRDNTFTCSIFSGPLWGLPVSEFTISILMPIFNLAISMGLGLLSYPYKIDGFNILTKPFEKNVLTKNLDFYNEMRDNLLIDPRLGLGPPTLYWIKALNDELDKLSKMPPPEIPQLTFMGDSDKVISKKAIETRIARTPLGELKILTNSMHEVFFETSQIKEEIWEEMDKFLNKIFPN